MLIANDKPEVEIKLGYAAQTSEILQSFRIQLPQNAPSPPPPSS